MIRLIVVYAVILVTGGLTQVALLAHNHQTCICLTDLFRW